MEIHRQKISTKALTGREGAASLLAVHEASHAVIASWLDIQGFKYVTIGAPEQEPSYLKDSDIESKGATVFDLTLNREEITPAHIQKRVLCTMAPAAVFKILGSDDPLSQGDETLINMMGEQLGDNELLWFSLMRMNTAELLEVQRIRTVIVEVAEALDSKGILSAAEVREILSEPVPMIPFEAQLLIGGSPDYWNLSARLKSLLPFGESISGAAAQTKEANWRMCSVPVAQTTSA